MNGLLGLVAALALLSAAGRSCHAVDLALVHGLAEHFGMQRISLICPLEHSLELMKAAFQPGYDLGTLHFLSEFSHLTDVEALEESSAVVCAEAFPEANVTELFSKSKELGVRKPWVFLHDNATSMQGLIQQLTLQMNQRVFFCDQNEQVIYEDYHIQDHNIQRRIARIELKNGSLLVKSEPRMENFIMRRSDFMGINFNVVIDQQLPYYHLPSLESHSKSKVFSAASGDKMVTLTEDEVYGIFHDMLFIMSVELNFTTNIMRRLDNVWGTAEGQYPNLNTTGMVSTVFKGDADLIGASLTLNPNRAKAVDYLIPIGTETYAFFIKSTGAEEFAWTVFLLPFSRDLWSFLMLNAVACMLLIKAFELYFNAQSRSLSVFKQLEDLLFYYWLTLCSYFGKGPPPIPGDRRTPFRALLFSLFLVANVVWMSYRASLTSELSNVVKKNPFNNLEELHHTDFEILMRKGGLSSTHFLEAVDGTIHHRIFDKFLKEKPPEEYLFPTIHEGLEALVQKPKAAYYNVLESIVTLSEYHCKVAMPWVSHFPSYLAMAVRKGDPNFQFLNQHTLRHSEKGTIRIISSRWKREFADCSSRNAQSLGMEKLVSLFGFLAMGSVLAVASFTGEAIVSHKKKSERLKKAKHSPDYQHPSQPSWVTSGKASSSLKELELRKRLVQMVENVQKNTADKDSFVQDLEELLLLLKQQNYKTF